MTIRETSTAVYTVDADVIALSFFEDERPLRGTSGLVDWRMNGAISRLIINGTVSGKEKETLILTTNGRMSSPRLFLFGLGTSGKFEQNKFSELLPAFVGCVTKLNLSRFAVTIPGSSLFSMDKMMDAVRAEFEKAGMPDDAEVVIIN